METKKVKIKIALVVDSNGDYSSCGWSRPKGDDPGEWFNVCLDGLYGEGTVEHKYIIEAEVSIPELPTIQGTATKQTED